MFDVSDKLVGTRNTCDPLVRRLGGQNQPTIRRPASGYVNECAVYGAGLQWANGERVAPPPLPVACRASPARRRPVLFRWRVYGVSVRLYRQDFIPSRNVAVAIDYIRIA